MIRPAPIGLALIVAGVTTGWPRVAPWVGGSAAAQEEPRPSIDGSVLDGVFTPSQATRGEQKFKQLCTACHTVREHAGRKFGAKWAETTLGDLFELISTTMPEGDPGSLQPEEYASILAFLLRERGYPEGQGELKADVPALKKIRIVPLPRPAGSTSEGDPER